jgi:hypothetical protein
LTRVTEQAQRQEFWWGWLKARLPAELAAHLTGVVERDGSLTIFAQSAAWVARLRFTVQELDSEIRAAAPALSTINVRVLPPGGDPVRP